MTPPLENPTKRLRFAWDIPEISLWFALDYPEICLEQVGAELGQAQLKLGLDFI